jgi:hypothetical protein
MGLTAKRPEKTTKSTISRESLVMHRKTLQERQSKWVRELTA